MEMRCEPLAIAKNIWIRAGVDAMELKRTQILRCDDLQFLCTICDFNLPPPPPPPPPPLLLLLLLRAGWSYAEGGDERRTLCGIQLVPEIRFGCAA
jgi:hypothetical protein